MSASSAGHKGFDLYKVLQVQRTATKDEIKAAYRKRALALHPDQHGGCERKSNEFRTATEAYQILKDHKSRATYDKTLPPPPFPNYRKVYTPQQPSNGYKESNAKQRNSDMHTRYKMMQEEIARARQRTEKMASSRRDSDSEYHSPLGKGFSFSSGGTNPYSNRRPQHHHPPSSSRDDKKSHQFYDSDGSSFRVAADRAIGFRGQVSERMHERRRNRVKSEENEYGTVGRGRKQQQDESGCVVM